MPPRAFARGTDADLSIGLTACVCGKRCAVSRTPPIGLAPIFHSGRMDPVTRSSVPWSPSTFFFVWDRDSGLAPRLRAGV